MRANNLWCEKILLTCFMLTFTTWFLLVEIRKSIYNSTYNPNANGLRLINLFSVLMNVYFYFFNNNRFYSRSLDKFGLAFSVFGGLVSQLPLESSLMNGLGTVINLNVANHNYVIKVAIPLLEQYFGP